MRSVPPSAAAPGGSSPVRVPLGRRGARSFPPPLSGKVLFETLESSVLRDNPLGDPASRTVACYTPPSGKTEGKPLLVLLSGFTGAGWMSFQRPTYLGLHLGEPQPQRLERLVRAGKCGEAVMVAPDCITLLGGSQFVNSSATGRYEDHVVQEVVPWAQEKFKTSGVAVLGQSSGGFGSLYLGSRHPKVFQAVGSSSGDMAFELSYLPDVPKAVRELAKHGGPEGFLSKMFEDPSVVKGPFDPSGAALNMLAMASCYSSRAGEGAAFDLPFEVESGLLIPEVWKRWLEFDPLRSLEAEDLRAALKRMKLVHLTASAPDEWALDVGARMFAARARRLGVPVLHEEFPGGHMQSGPRFETLLTHLVNALA